MIAFWLVLMFFGVSMLTYGVLLLRSNSDSPAE
jgi:hypothetical protein